MIDWVAACPAAEIEPASGQAEHWQTFEAKPLPLIPISGSLDGFALTVTVAERPSSADADNDF